MTLNDVRREVIAGFNLNTVVAIVGFLTLFASITAVWTGMQFRQEETNKWISAHEASHSRQNESFGRQLTSVSTRIDAFQPSLNEITQLQYRLAQLEKAHEAMDARITRITESYGNQFTEMRGQLGTIATQLALANDALKRLETSRGSTGR